MAHCTSDESVAKGIWSDAIGRLRNPGSGTSNSKKSVLSAPVAAEIRSSVAAAGAVVAVTGVLVVVLVVVVVVVVVVVAMVVEMVVVFMLVVIVEVVVVDHPPPLQTQLTTVQSITLLMTRQLVSFVGGALKK